MKREDFERLKEEEKKHLREIRNLKQQLKDAERLQRIGRALSDIERSGELEGFDSSLEDVQRSAAEQEARLEIAAEGAAETARQIEVSEIDEEALAKARAAEFIRRMKVSMAEGEEPTSPASTASEKSERAAKESVPRAESAPEKTIGRMAPKDKGK